MPGCTYGDHRCEGRQRECYRCGNIICQGCAEKRIVRVLQKTGRKPRWPRRWVKLCYGCGYGEEGPLPGK